MYHIFFIHSSVEGHLDCFQFLAIMKKAAIIIVEQVFLWNVGASFGYIPRSGIAGLEVELFPVFFETAKLIPKVSVQICTHQQCGPVPHHSLNVLSLEFLILAILMGVRWNLRVILTCISMMTKDIEHSFKCFSAIRDSSVENFLFSSVLHFFFWLGYLFC